MYKEKNANAPPKKAAERISAARRSSDGRREFVDGLQLEEDGAQINEACENNFAFSLFTMAIRWLVLH